MIEFFEDEELDVDDDFKPVPQESWIPELEQRVKEYMLISPDLPKNTIKHVHVTIPDFKTAESAKQFWFEQIKRCREGYNGMCGKMYFFYNFCYMENIKSGRIKPDYRVIDNEWFSFIEKAQKSREWGVVCVKRRRVGASWKEASDVLHDCLFNKHLHVGMNSKSEKDSIHLFAKVKFIYNNLPKELRVKTSASNTKMFLDFSEKFTDEAGNKNKRGNQSDIIIVAPTDSAYEGRMLNKWVCDEAGKIINLPQLWSFTEDCLMQETRREGCPVIFGTSGDVGKDGAGLRDMWENADIYKLRRFFFAGWLGLNCDEYGNDNKEECIRWIIYERRRREKLNTKFYNDYIQKYPLTVEEAFTDNTSFGLGDSIKLKAQRASLVLNPIAQNRGYFKEVHGKIEFISDRTGHCIIYEQPKPHKRGGYIAGCDPADIDDVHGEVSDLSTYIVATQEGLSQPRIVFEYTDRPRELNRYYDQVAMALRYYNDCKVLIERQKGGRMISYINDLGYKYLLMTQPQEVQRLVAGRSNSIGVHMNQFALEYGRGVTTEYIDDNYELIPSIPLIEECLAFGTKNTDKAMAFLITMIALKEINKPYLKNKLTLNNKLPSFKYQKGLDGSIRLVRK